MSEEAVPKDTTPQPPRAKRWRRRIVAMLVGLLVSLSLIVVLDYAWGRIRVRLPNHIQFQWPNDLREPHPKLGYVFKPNAVGHHLAYTSQGVIYDVTYTIDNLGRRVTPDPSTSADDHFIAFFGCSLTFGVGVEDDETLPSQIAESIPDAAVYNYGVDGYGTANVLMTFEARDLPKEIKFSKGIGIYTFVRHHPWRNTGSMHCSGQWGPGFPAYEIRDGDLVYLGSFQDVYPWRTRIYRFLNKSSFLTKWEIPPVLLDRHIQLTVRIIREARQRFVEQFPEAEFAVMIYPYREPEPQLAALVPSLLEQGIRVFDYSELPLDVPGGPFFPEAHPKPETQALVAQQLAQDLEVLEVDLHASESAQSHGDASVTIQLPNEENMK